MVATAAQIAANRANARRSTGPRTAEGKAASSRNALTHGAYASDIILATAPTTHLEVFRAHFQPVGVLEAHLVDHLAVLASRRERLNAAMDALLELNERHALTEHLHERYGINTPNGEALGQPSWQAALRRYDGNPGADPRRPGLDSDPALDPDPILCSLAYTLSGPRAAALFRHEASVDRRFSATLKQLTTLQTQRRGATATSSTTPPAAPLYEPSLQRALDRYLRATATPAEPWFEPVPAAVPAPPDPIPAQPAPTADPAPAPLSGNQAFLPNRTQLPRPEPGAAAPPEQNEPGTAYEQKEPNWPGAALEQKEPNWPATAGNSIGTPRRPIPPDRGIEPNSPGELPDDQPIFLSVLPRHPDEPSSIPAHWHSGMRIPDMEQRRQKP